MVSNRTSPEAKASLKVRRSGGLKATASTVKSGTRAGDEKQVLRLRFGYKAPNSAQR